MKTIDMGMLLALLVSGVLLGWLLHYNVPKPPPICLTTKVSQHKEWVINGPYFNIKNQVGHTEARVTFFEEQIDCGERKYNRYSYGGRRIK